MAPLAVERLRGLRWVTFLRSVSDCVIAHLRPFTFRSVEGESENSKISESTRPNRQPQNYESEGGRTPAKNSETSGRLPTPSADVIASVRTKLSRAGACRAVKSTMRLTQRMNINSPVLRLTFESRQRLSYYVLLTAAYSSA
ncbi:hypothetical protein EVAR_45528_1 [Eumeta japonica]|uniref:Uncharacterized protein n=1 Tax=Eumeta variegata TaxID=151549 RepID=A0A4C1X6D6_EUMVA|nr:hypothetical protein EVAR_45528_1 [Eumeta japonica]